MLENILDMGTCSLFQQEEGEEEQQTSKGVNAVHSPESLRKKKMEAGKKEMKCEDGLGNIPQGVHSTEFRDQREAASFGFVETVEFKQVYFARGTKQEERRAHINEHSESSLIVE